MRIRLSSDEKNEKGEAEGEQRISRNLQQQKKRQLSNCGKRAEKDGLAISHFIKVS